MKNCGMKTEVQVNCRANGKVRYFYIFHVAWVNKIRKNFKKRPTEAFGYMNVILWLTIIIHQHVSATRVPVLGLVIRTRVQIQ